MATDLLILFRDLGLRIIIAFYKFFRLHSFALLHNDHVLCAQIGQLQHLQNHVLVHFGVLELKKTVEFFVEIVFVQAQVILKLLKKFHAIKFLDN